MKNSSQNHFIRSGRSRRAHSMLELQMAFVIFGIILAGIAPFAIMQLKLIRRIESRLQAGTTYYLLPARDLWARKLGARSRMLLSVQDLSSIPKPAPANPLTVVLWSYDGINQAAVAEVLITTSSP